MKISVSLILPLGIQITLKLAVIVRHHTVPPLHRLIEENTAPLLDQRVPKGEYKRTDMIELG